MYLEKRGRRWLALHYIPKDVQDKLGRRFVQSLETEDRREANLRAAALLPRWLAEIERARNGAPSGLERDYGFWRKGWKEAGNPAERQLIEEVFTGELDSELHGAAERAGITDPDDPRIYDLPEYEQAKGAFDYVTGRKVRFTEHLEEYLAKPKVKELKQKTQDMRRANIEKFAEAFPFTDDVRRREVQRYIDQVLAEGKKLDTVYRVLTDLRSYWASLQSVELVSEDHMPFERLTLPKKRKVRKEKRRHAIAAEDVVRLLRAAERKNDDRLADLIRLGMWTGARIEELCALRVEHIHPTWLKLVEAKTGAGIRQVPIHPKLRPTIERLVGDRAGGHLLAGLTANKYGNWSGAIGTRFTRLKRAEGFGPKHTFHSLRHTVATLLDNAGVDGHRISDILGHEDKGNFSVGYYSDGGEVPALNEAIERIDYPGYPAPEAA